MREENHMFQGLRRDNHPIKQESKFLWDALNVRLTNRDDSTLLSITNEKGTLDTEIEDFKGQYVGHCTVGKYLIVFTYDDDEMKNYIYRVCRDGDSYTNTKLFEGTNDDETKLWTPNNPIEAFGVYENDLVQKVYWVDGANQPRVINICKGYQEDYTHESFDFVQTLQLEEKVTVEKLYNEGLFAPGVIQYAFTYYNKYGQETNIFYTTPLNYISPKDRGGNPEERVNNSFRITINNLDKFEFLRVYSIHRTSINGTPQVKRVADVSLKNGDEYLTEVSYVDNGTTGESVDPTFLLYVGGKEIVASTMCSKDGTLFLGNIELKEGKDWLEIKEDIKKAYKEGKISFGTIESSEWKQEEGAGKYYNYELSPEFRGFKTGEIYRLGIQFQYKTGVWSEPIWLEDAIINSSYPYLDINTYKWYSKVIYLESTVVRKIIQKGYRKIRTCVVFPSILDRTIICQGVLCPTVYSVGMRSTDSPYAMSSWFFRPQTKNKPEEYKVNTDNLSTNTYKGAAIQFKHNYPILTGGNRGAEIQCTPWNNSIETINNISDVSKPDAYNNYFFVDSNLVTMHSPDIEFDTSIQNIVWEDNNVELKILGSVSLGSIIGDIDIITSTPTIKSTSIGFNHRMIGYQIGNDANTMNINGGLVSGISYWDAAVTNDNKPSEEISIAGYLVYPWHRSGSLNNSSRISKQTTDDTISTVQSALLQQKKISNLKFFNEYTPVSKELLYNIGTPQLFMSDVVSMKKVWVDYLQKEVPYFGNVDTLITPNDENGYTIYRTDSNQSWQYDEIDNHSFKGNDPVRMKYKSTPHLVFPLKPNKTSEDTNYIEILPTKYGDNWQGDETYKTPSWDQTSPPTPVVPTPTTLDLGILWTKSDLEGLVIGESSVGKYIWFQNYAFKNSEIGVVAYIGGMCTGETIEEGLDFTCFNEIKEGTLFKVTSTENGEKDNATFVDGELYTGDLYYLKVTKAEVIDYNYICCTMERLQTIPSAKVRRDVSAGTTFKLSQEFLNYDNYDYNPFLVLAELRRKTVENRFGGDTPSALRANLWLPAGEPTPLELKPSQRILKANFTYGDTWYSRYDCLKTYPFTQEDENQVVEIGSFMCETRVNIDGRYDNNRGQLSNINMSPTNFNLLNEVYSQKDNFFNYRILEDDYYKVNKFSNQITWSLEKFAASDTDPWTKVTLANTLDMDGNKGQITAIRQFNQHLLCFQEKAISAINYNNRVEIPTSDGVPIEITNGRKVDGYTFLSNSIGCQNKWSIVNSNLGIYFIDNNTDTLYSYNGELSPLSDTTGMKWWFKQNHTLNKWYPKTISNNGLRTYYDAIYGDVYFSPGPDNEERNALCFSEKIGNFTSQMSYGGVSAMFNLNDKFYSLKYGEGGLKLYLNNEGGYNSFYGEEKPWYISFISNDNPIYTKIFDTIELRADIYDGDKLLQNCPIEYISVKNEYQEGREEIDYHNARKKFRVWRCNIPRSNLIGKMSTHFEQIGQDLQRKHGRARIRNPWTQITIGREAESPTKVIIHDVSVKYTL